MIIDYKHIFNKSNYNYKNTSIFIMAQEKVNFYFTFFFAIRGVESRTFSYNIVLPRASRTFSYTMTSHSESNSFSYNDVRNQ